MAETRDHGIDAWPPAAAPSPGRADVAVLTLKRLAAAFHTCRLYHPRHPYTGDAVHRFLDLQGRYAEEYGPLVVEVTRSSFILDADGIERKDDLVAPLVFSLHARGVRRFSLSAGTAAGEIQDLLEILTTSRANVRRAGGAGKALRERGVQHIVLQDALPAGDGLPKGEDERIPAVPAPAALPGGTRSELRSLLQDPAQTAAFVETLVDGAAAGEDPAVQAERLYGALHPADGAILSAPPPSRPPMLRNLTRAIIRLSPPVGPALRGVIVARAGDDPFAAALVVATPDQDLRAILEEALQGAEPARRDALALAVARALFPDGQRLHRLLENPSPLAPPTTLAHALGIAEADRTAHPVHTALPPGPPTALFGARDDTDARLAGLRALGTLLENVTPQGAHTLFLSLEREILHLVDRGKVDAVTHVLTDLGAHGQPDAAHVLLRGLPGRDLVQRLVERIPPGSLEGETHLWTFFWELRDDLIPVLLDILEHEERLSVRRTLFTILARVGRDRVSFFVSKLADPTWYVVRNVVGILGEIRNPATLRYLRRPLLHAEPRVRREVMRVLTEWGSLDALTLLSDVLRRGDLETRRLAASWLGVSGSPEAVAILLDVIRQRDPFLRDFAVKREAVAALGRLGAQAAVSALRPLARSPLALVSRRHRLLGREARAALAAIHARMEAGATLS